MTTILNEQKVLNLETTSGSVKLNCEARLNASGDILHINGQIKIEDSNVGYFSVNENQDDKLNTNINVSDSINLSSASMAVNMLITDIETMNPV